MVSVDIVFLLIGRRDRRTPKAALQGGPQRPSIGFFPLLQVAGWPHRGSVSSRLGDKPASRRVLFNPEISAELLRRRKITQRVRKRGRWLRQPGNRLCNASLRFVGCRSRTDRLSTPPPPMARGSNRAVRGPLPPVRSCACLWLFPTF